MELSTHKKRIATAVALAVLPVSGLLLGGWVMALVAALFTALALWEFYSLPTERIMGKRQKTLGVACGLLMVLAARLGPDWSLAALAVSFWIVAMHYLISWSMDKEGTSPVGYLLCLAGLLYLPLFLQCFLWMSNAEIIMVLFAAIATDTGAYYTGSNVGGPKIWPGVSPKKTWSGSLGGMAACVLFVLVYGLIFGHAAWWAWVLLGIFLNVAAQLGDFFESAYKRMIGIKDSGRILPGHGGILDRIDGLLFAVAVYMAARLLHPFFS